jgi:pimeloyl-ACP methyl ester carboxylesterase
MKRPLFTFFVLFLLCSFATNAQPPKELIRSWTAFAQTVDIRDYRGMNFTLESRIRVKLTPDSSGKAAMWARVDAKGGRGFFDNMSGRPVTSAQWTPVLIKGKIDSTAEALALGGLCYYNGQFYYDDFVLKIETPDGWKMIPLKSGNFEGDNTNAWAGGIGNAPVKVKGFDFAFIKEPGTRNTILQMTGSSIASYGNNKKTAHTFTTNGVTLYYEVYGKGKPILLLHGNGQSISAFTQQIPFFEKEYQLIIPDCRGRGKSTDSEAELTYHIQASDMNNLLNHLNIDSAHIIGWSDGGIIGLIMAMDYPKKVKSLIASGANVLQDTTAYFPKDLADMKETAGRQDVSLMTRKRILLMLNHPNLPFSGLGKIKCPTMIVAGDQDEIRIAHTVKIFESIPGAQLFIVPKTSHYVLSENPKVFNEAALLFLKNQ